MQFQLFEKLVRTNQFQIEQEKLYDWKINGNRQKPVFFLNSNSTWKTCIDTMVTFQAHGKDNYHLSVSAHLTSWTSRLSRQRIVGSRANYLKDLWYEKKAKAVVSCTINRASWWTVNQHMHQCMAKEIHE